MPRYTMGCPSGKRRFAMLEQADAALDSIWRFAIAGTTKSEKLPCRSYPCDDCGGYHHTSQPYPDSYWEYSDELEEEVA